jgi:hypothetical protein
LDSGLQVAAHIIECLLEGSIYAIGVRGNAGVRTEIQLLRHANFAVQRVGQREPVLAPWRYLIHEVHVDAVGLFLAERTYYSK